MLLYYLFIHFRNIEKLIEYRILIDLTSRSEVLCKKMFWTVL